MQFTPQQMAGYKGYSTGVLIGNWSEDIQVQEDKLRAFQAQSQQGGVDPVAILLTKVSVMPVKADGYVRFSAPLQIKSLINGGADEQALAMDTAPKRRPKLNHAVVTLATAAAPLARSVWTLHKTRDSSNALYKANEADVLHFGQLCRIVNEFGSIDGFHSLTSEKQTATCQSRGGKQLVSAGLGSTSDMNFVFEPADASSGSDGEPIRVGARVVIRHAMTRTPLFADAGSKLVTVGGPELEVSAHMAKLQATKVTMPQTPPNFWTVHMAAPGTVYRAPNHLPPPEQIFDRVKSRILQRSGNQGFRGLIRALRVMDADGSSSLTRLEFKEGMKNYGIEMATSELDQVFSVFDRNGDGTISVEEFLRTLRGPISTRRLKLVKDAFACVDHDGSGIVTFDELKRCYARSLEHHPAVVAGTKTEAQLLRDFVADWDKNADGKVTLDEFVEYYSDVSVSIDSDDYFELMMRNAWHMSGGSGATENTSNKRVLVTHHDGRQEVVELTNDLGLDTRDLNVIRRKLEQQGVRDIKSIGTAH
jgi:Ca2+-binding EF-hand superfamily protein